VTEDRRFLVPDIRGEDHVRLFVALWVVWTCVSLFCLILGLLISSAHSWLADGLVFTVLLMYPAVTTWYLSQSWRRIRKSDRFRHSMSAAFLLSLAVILIRWTVANSSIDDTPIDWITEDSLFLNPVWYGHDHASWGWPYVFLRRFHQPAPEVGTWLFEASALGINMAVVCFALWWVAVAAFVASAFSGRPSPAGIAQPTITASAGER
jgi:hypothetical protein